MKALLFLRLFALRLRISVLSLRNSVFAIHRPIRHLVKPSATTEGGGAFGGPCWLCGQYGHEKKNCPSPPKNLPDRHVPAANEVSRISSSTYVD